MADWIKFALTLICSGAFFTFLQFLITRHDSKANKFTELETKITTGLKEREDTGKERFETHRDAIEELRKVILSLSESTQETQKCTMAVGELVVGLGQDKLVYLTDKYRNRGGITLKEQANLKSIYIPYHDKLNGNGYGEIGYTYCMNELPIISEEDALYCDKNYIKYTTSISRKGQGRNKND